jgi:hypothetical protein
VPSSSSWCRCRALPKVGSGPAPAGLTAVSMQLVREGRGRLNCPDEGRCKLDASGPVGVLSRMDVASTPTPGDLRSPSRGWEDRATLLSCTVARRRASSESRIFGVLIAITYIYVGYPGSRFLESRWTLDQAGFRIERKACEGGCARRRRPSSRSRQPGAAVPAARLPARVLNSFRQTASPVGWGARSFRRMMLSSDYNGKVGHRASR